MQIIRQLLEIILRKRQPQDLSHSLNAAIICCIGIAAMGTAVYSQIPTITQPFIYNVAMVIFQAVGIYALLGISNKTSRYIQTITAIFGVSLILQILTIAVGQISFLAPLSLFFTIWNFVLVVFILRAALESSTGKAVLLTMAYHLFMGVMMAIIFPKFPLELQAILESLNTTATTPISK